MALPTNTFTTYEAIGNREDLSDVIYRIDPTDTPFMNGVEREKASAVNHEWQTQALASADNTNAQLEGDDANTNSTTATVRLGNICQISTKVARVTGTQRAVDHAGRDDELAYQEIAEGPRAQARYGDDPLRHQSGQSDGQRYHGKEERFRAELDQNQHQQGHRRRRRGPLRCRRHRHPH